jgi:enoyl-CoA hydratase/carnithine racemase
MGDEARQYRLERFRQWTLSQSWPQLKVLYLTGFSDRLFKERVTLWEDAVYDQCGVPLTVRLDGRMHVLAHVAFRDRRRDNAAELAGRSEALVSTLADGPTGSYAGTKRQLNRWLYEQMPAQLEFEAQIQQERAASGDFAEGVAAFAEKRSPRFTGS